MRILTISEQTAPTLGEDLAVERLEGVTSLSGLDASSVARVGAEEDDAQVDVALAKGYFEEAGVEVEIVSFPSGREGFEALIGGQVDVAFMAEFPAAVGVLRAQDFKVIGDLARFRGSRVIGNAKAGPLASPADLSGRNIGTVLGTNVDYYLSKVLEGAGVTATVINAGPADLAPAVARGDVDAMVTFPTFYASARQALGDDYVEHFGETRDDRIREFHEMNEHPVVGLWEGGFLEVEDQNVRLVGSDARLFLRGESARDVTEADGLSMLMTSSS